MLDLSATFAEFPVLMTERFILRPFRESDAEAILAYMSNPAVTKYLPSPTMTHIEEALARIERNQQLYKDQEAVIWGIATRDTDTIIGNCLLFSFQSEHFRAEVGYSLSADYWRKGVATEVVSRTLDYAFNETELHSVYANIDPRNEASQYLLEKLGFVKEAHFKEDYFDAKTQTFTDTAIYSMLRQKWLQRKL
ncbi:MAG: GNAT family N-acetyltransferase [Anaerolineae bacterium]|nr:GNAT family N-acetyltransferase [Anaerolineae bacterium]MCB9460347.1 GNAT family N-acetyltransferase [Anaerolineaceae bacterium]